MFTSIFKFIQPLWGDVVGLQLLIIVGIIFAFVVVVRYLMGQIGERDAQIKTLIQTLGSTSDTINKLTSSVSSTKDSVLVKIDSSKDLVLARVEEVNIKLKDLFAFLIK